MSLTTIADIFGDEDMDEFGPVVRNIPLERLPLFALSIRESQQAATKASPEAVDSSEAYCTIEHPALFGSYHVVFVVRFADGARWAFKVPINGYDKHFDEISSRALVSEALTMKLIARETTIPVPRVHHFASSFNNELQCPFILMDFIGGIPGPKCWFDDSIDKVLLQQRRARTLQDVVNAMVQLSKFSYSVGGAVQFDNDGNPIGIGPIRIPDYAADLEQDTDEESEDLPVFCEVGPFASATDFMMHHLNRRAAPQDSYSQGTYKLLRLFITWSLEDEDESHFVITHPDFDIQNIIVTDDGALAGLIDWDGVGAYPICLGNGRLPGWLTRDWDPMAYSYEEASDHAAPNAENSPEELAQYRSMYLAFIRASGLDAIGKQYTGRSLLIENLQIAADSPHCTHGIVERIFQEAYSVRKARISMLKKEGDPDEVKDIDENEVILYELVTELNDGEFDPEQLAKVKEGFDELCVELDQLDAE